MSSGGGDCYVVAGMLVALGVVPGGMLCHGTCTGSGPIAGIAFGHAWVELDLYDEDGVFTMVIEKSNGHNAIVSRGDYYEAGECRDVTRYTQDEARLMMAKHRHYGPWTTTQEKETR